MNTKARHNILVTGVGAIIGYGIIESLRMSGKDVFIVGIDIYDDCYGKYICDQFEVAPYTADPAYFTWLAGVCNKYNIDLIIPGIEQDVVAYNMNRSAMPCKTSLNNKHIINISSDKLDTYHFLQTVNGINVIPTFTGLSYTEAADRLGLPFIIKPRRSYASKGFHVIKNEDDLIACAHDINENTLFQKSIGSNDDEYTFSVFGNGDGTIADQVILRRYLSKEGATQKANVIPKDDALQDFVNKLVQHLKPIGPTNFQFRKQDGIAYLLEINPRISSACSIRSKFGYNEPKACIEYYLEDGKVEVMNKTTGYAIRYIQDHIVYE
jgi:carbamoyl-phosphate synthase large subunit